MSMYMWPNPILYKKMPKMIILPEKKNRARPTNPYILESVSSGECHKHIYMATPLSVFKEKAKNSTFARRKNGGATGLKLLHANTT